MVLSRRCRILAVSFALVAGAAAPSARAAPAARLITLDGIEVKDGRVELRVSRAMGAERAQIDAFNDIVQVSLPGLGVYPAKIQSFPRGLIAKIFAYQYAPRLVRLRITVRGKAEALKSVVRVSASGGRGAPGLLISLGGESADQLRVVAAQAERPVAARPRVGAGANPSAVVDADREKALLERILQQPEAAEAPAAVADRSATAPERVSESSREPAARAGRNAPVLPGVGKVLLRLLLVVGAFLGLALVVRRLRGNSSRRGGAVARSRPFVAVPANASMGGGWLRRAATTLAGRAGAPGPAPMVEVLANHYLSPKKSIAVVKVAGRILVLGMTDERMDLISQIPASGQESDEAPMDELSAMAEIDAKALAGLGLTPAVPSPTVAAGQGSGPGSGAEAAGPAVFRVPGQSAPAPASAAPGARDLIRQRLQGMKEW